MTTVITFANKSLADSVLNEIAATPYESVWVWYDPDQPTNVIRYVTSTDGRCAIAHHWGEQDRAWLEAYLDGMAGVTIGDELPKDWRYPTGP